MKPSTYTSIGNIIELIARPVALAMLVFFYWLAGLNGIIIAAIMMIFYEVTNYFIYVHQPQQSQTRHQQPHHPHQVDDE